MVECAHGSTVGMPRCEHTVIVLSLKAKVCVHVRLEHCCTVGLSVFSGQEKLFQKIKEERARQ